MSDCCCFQTLAQLVTGAVVLNFLWGCWNIVSIYILGKCPNFSKYGSWSVVTGGTDGIGLAFAKKLAAKGQNIALISRNPEKLELVAKEIHDKYGVDTVQIDVDFSESDIYDKIQLKLKGLDVGTLINNVGISYEYPDYFLKFAENPVAIQTMININIISVTKMIQIILPEMLKKKKGIILNLSSGSAVQPTPLLGLYSASKLFVDCLSKCISAEYGDQGVIVQSIVPLYVTTKMSKIRRPTLFVPTPEVFVSSALKTIGRCKRSYGYWAHAIQGKIFEIVPESLFLLGAKKMSLGIRAKALKKREQASKGK